MFLRRPLRILGGLAGLTALAAGCYWSARLAWADYLFRLDTLESVSRAAQLAPGSAEYHQRLAALLATEGRDGGSVEFELNQAVAANPRLAAAWTELALCAEAAGQPQQAETYLVRAAGADHMYATLWTLANFYFRQNAPEKFWPAAKRALRAGDVSAYDPAPLFRLCWKISANPATVLERAIPDAGPVEARYLEFLVRENLTQVAEPVTERLVAFGSEQDLDAMFLYCDRLLAAGDAEGGIHAWNALCWRKLQRYRPIEPESSAALTNGNFSSPPLQHGFDWRIPAVAGIAVERAGSPPRLWITLDGHEPETCDVLEQFLALTPSRKYRLRFRYQTDDIGAGSGLRWHISTPRGEEIPSEGADLASEQQADGTVRFPPTLDTSTARISTSGSPSTLRNTTRSSFTASGGTPAWACGAGSAGTKFRISFSRTECSIHTLHAFPAKHLQKAACWLAAGLMGTQTALSECVFQPAKLARPARGTLACPRATSCVLLATDLFAIFTARVLAITICQWFHPAIGFPNFLGFRESMGLLALTYAALGLYAGGGLSAVEELRRVVLGTGFVCLLLTASLFFLHPQPYPGLLILCGSFTAAAVPLARSAVRTLFAKTRWWGVPVIVLGAGHTATALIERLHKHPEIGFKPLACFDDDHQEQGECEGVPVYGPLSQAGALAKSLKIHHALVAIPGMAREDLVWMLDDWGTVFTHVILIPSLFGLASLWASTRDIGMLGLEMRQNLLIPFNCWTKRAMDIAGALILGLIALPVLGAAAIWIKLVSRGSVLYSQEREGEKGRGISIVKLRTMRPDAESVLVRVLSESSEIRAEWECRFKLRKDPRILGGVGKFLRKTSLDELPQLWSVLKGEMSLVGPRPFPRYHLNGFGQRFRTLRGRVKPGLTGLWQVSDRADGDLEVQETLDTYYIRNWSLWLDLYILARTVRAVLFPRGAY